MKYLICTVLGATLLLVGTVQAQAWASRGFHGSTVVVVSPGNVVVAPNAVVVAPQRTFIVANHRPVIIEPVSLARRQFFIPPGVVVPPAFRPFRTFHHHFGRVIVFVDPVTAHVWPSGFWCWGGSTWAWVPRTIMW